MRERNRKMDELDEYYAKIDKVVNLTPKEITILVEGRTMRIPPSGRLAKIYIKRTDENLVGYVMGEIPVFQPKPIEAEGVPEPKPGVVYLVSSLVAQVIRRKDVLSPDSLPGGMIKDYQGRVMGIHALQYWGDEGESEE